MTVETATKISELVATNPPGSDPKSEGDNHLRLLKGVLQDVFDDSGTTLKTTLPIESPAGALLADFSTSGNMTFSGAAPKGLKFTDSNLSWMERKAGTPAGSLDRLALNSNAAGSGTDVAVFDRNGNLSISGGGVIYSRLATNRIGFKWQSPDLFYDIDIGGAASRLWSDANNPTPTKGNPGYMRLANGMILQWNYYPGNNGDIFINFPSAFPTICAIMQVTPIGSPPSTSVWQVHADQVSGVGWAYRPRYAANGGSVATGAIACYWLALGW